MDSLLVEVIGNPAKCRVAQIAGILALTTDIVDILASLLIRTDHGIVAVDSGWDTRPNTLTVIAVLDQALATGKGVIHSLALRLIKNSWPWSVTTRLWLIVLVLGEWVRQAVTDQNGLDYPDLLAAVQDLI